jgi:succinate dehydrogenase/fumarate reductase flavoprotein subunit
MDEIRRLKEMKRGEKPLRIKKDLQRLAWENMLVHINERSLTQALAGIREIHEKRCDRMSIQNPEDLVDALELKNLLLVAEILGRTTQMRKESRGDLYREDYPHRDDRNWNKVIMVRKRGEEMELKTQVIDPDWPAAERPGDMGGLRWG